MYMIYCYDVYYCSSIHSPVHCCFQALLHVAKQLFSRLGECQSCEGKETRNKAHGLISLKYDFPIKHFCSDSLGSITYSIHRVGSSDQEIGKRNKRTGSGSSHKEVPSKVSSQDNISNFQSILKHKKNQTAETPTLRPSATLQVPDPLLLQGDVTGFDEEAEVDRLMRRKSRAFSSSMRLLFDPTSREEDFCSFEDFTTSDLTSCAESDEKHSFSETESESFQSSSSTDSKSMDTWPTFSNQLIKRFFSPRKKNGVKPAEKMTNRRRSLGLLMLLTSLKRKLLLFGKAPKADKAQSKHNLHTITCKKYKGSAGPGGIIPFSQVRKFPAKTFALQDGTICPYTEILRQIAPPDGSYSSGDFLCM